ALSTACSTPSLTRKSLSSSDFSIGTAATEAAEFYDIYKMNVVTIPTNVGVKRVDEEDEFYKDTADKFAAIAKKIKHHADLGQPVLVGTVS
ncbi:hypothetical protein ACMYMJ_23805, partial [Salmonella enterica subsp. enterica serovar Enteritidis]|uniref:preprotein translocase subunit SecA n=1 Tax=Salmonella enterica TaxID=28901 RepID=UPI0039EBDD34